MLKQFLPLILALSAGSIYAEVAPTPQETAAVAPILAKGAIVSSKEGHFSVQLPDGFATTDTEVQPIQTEMGEIETINYTSFTETSAAMVGASEYPEALLVFIKGKEKEVLDGAQEGALRNVNGSVVSEENTQIDSFPARTVTFSAEADGQPLFGKALFILANSRLYHILFISNNEAEIKNSNVDAFFKSFKITQ